MILYAITSSPRSNNSNSYTPGRMNGSSPLRRSRSPGTCECPDRGMEAGNVGPSRRDGSLRERGGEKDLVSQDFALEKGLKEGQGPCFRGNLELKLMSGSILDNYSKYFCMFCQNCFSNMS